MPTAMRGAGLLFSVLSVAGPIFADNIVTVHGDPISSAGENLFIDESLAASWTETGSYSNVDITVKLLIDTGFPLRNVTAYLTDSIGPGTTTADEIVPSFTFPGVAGSFPFQPTYTVFQGLTLSAGTYYLTLFSDAPTFNTPVAWSVASHSTSIETGPGVTRNSDLSSFGNAQNTFAPASTFSPLSFDSEDPLEFSVTGTPSSTTVPEPSSLCLLALCAALSVSAHRALKRNRL
jgi:hypothetical protein